MWEKNKISVIIPVYNAESHIKKCVDSIINQTYTNLEIILIDDKSTDNSKNIILEYENNKKIKIIYNKENRGAGYSRNRGLEIATGNFLSFIDSDDYIDKDYYEQLISTITKENADIALCDIKIIYDSKIKREKAFCNNKLTKSNIINTPLAASPCNKLFKKELFNNYNFIEDIITEDVATIIPLIINSKHIAYTSKCSYNYVQKENSVQNKKFAKKNFDIFKSVKLALSRINDKDKEKYKDIIILNQIIYLLLYKIILIPKLNIRAKILTEYYKLTKDFNIKNNIYLIEHLKQYSKIKRIYYKLIIYFNQKNINYIASSIISISRFIIKLYRKNVTKMNIDLKDLKKIAQKQKNKKEPKITISAVVPNYNYEKYLYERIHSILNQNYKINEIIILDDKSTDNSIQIINEINNEISKYIKLKVILNEVNSGSPFKQWAKGFRHAESDYVWIAEADDYCKKNFLKNLVKPCKKNKNIIISYSQTSFINYKGEILTRNINNLIDILNTKHWDKKYINNGYKEITDYMYLNCTIPNVSGCIIKNNNYKNIFKESQKFKQTGDWYFYINVLEQGNIAFCKKRLNYYRIHQNNLTNTNKLNKHLEEIIKIHNFCQKRYDLNEAKIKNMEERRKYLEKEWNNL